MKLPKLTKDFLNDYYMEAVRNLGVKVPPEQKAERLKICRARNGGKPCELHGMVNPAPGVHLEGCTKCGCPLELKAEFDRFKLVGTKITCPHPEGNLWALIDQKFQD